MDCHFSFLIFNGPSKIPDMTGDETQPRTLYVGNLDAQMTEEFLVVLFSQIGPVKGCKIIHEVGTQFFLSKRLQTASS